ncbi:glycoside hydrolase family 2 protein [Lentimicrobium sp.]|uniref:beta-mannosidase n=1 Tax=Lentimicrobium sp. TaxID=2034841 RepID=UPI002C58BBD2|nr:glycoside hydrolase family 2 protein [Lentimicrobium sp.]HPF65790.1 glycoside hydrolase family 2 protein [Lentimicrobium sp.]HPR26461.1 glycoside hydrolase family 2 protein [Lentimicrobium sp.]
MKKLIAFFILLPWLVMAGALNLRAQTSVVLHNNWEFRQAGTLQWYPALVPGTVHTDLLANGLIEDPYYRLNEKNLQWIDKVNWEYRTRFRLDAAQLRAGSLMMRFHGLDTYATVMVNGALLFKADNFHRTWEAEAGNHLKEGDNEIFIRFESPVMRGLMKQEALGYALPADNDQSENGGMGPVRISIFTRKPGYHFGWDWGPRLVTSGIWRPVELIINRTARINDLFVRQESVTAKEARVTAGVEVNVQQEGLYKLEILMDGQAVAAREISMSPGIRYSDIDFIIKNPRLWWPNGAGGQPLYTVSAVLSHKGKELHAFNRQIGIRSLKHVRRPDAKGGGESFHFEVNGRPVFAKGANYIPNDVFLPRVDSARYEFIVKSAAEANINMLRVWGGGIYENDYFYDLCDRHGIMVWQDFMFACAMYPGDKDFLNNVRLEAVDNIKRLRNHACIALWCGNNEIEYAWAEGDFTRGWGWKEKYDKAQQREIWQSYDTLFHHILPAAVKQYAPDHAYWPSSPTQGGGVLANWSGNRGDVHYWGVWHGQEPISAFRNYKARFMSEYGFQSFPEFNSVKKYTLPEDWNIESPVMASHQRSGIGNLRIRQYMEQDYQIPENFEHLLYVGQLLQADAIGMALRTHRSDMPFCMGSLYWQLNDVWPVASWSGIDYYGKWKAMHYSVKDALKNQIIQVVVEDGKLLVYGVSDTEKKTPAILRLNLADFSGLSLWNRPYKVTLPANGAALICSIDLKELPLSYRENSVFFTATLMDGSRVIDQEFAYFAKPKDLRLPEPGLKSRISDKGDHFVIEITSRNFCKNLMLVSDSADVNFSDNFFDMQPGETRLITCPATMRWEDFEKGFRMLHLGQTMKKR